MHKSRIHLKHSNNSDNGDLDADMLVHVAVDPQKQLHFTEKCSTRLNDTMQQCENNDKVQCIVELLDIYR